MIEHRPLLKSFHYALQGIHFAFKYNQNIRIHFLIAFFVIVFALALRISGFEMGILGIMILLVISTEMINTSIEEMTNLISREHSKEAKIAKDVSAGMVLLTSTGSAIVGVLIFLPHIIKLFS